MEYTDDQQMALDVDWFAVDSEGRIAHFASAGRPLPRSVSQSQEDNAFVSDFFRSLPTTRRIGEADPEVETYVTFENPAMRSRYLADFRSMSSRGLYSYDTTLPGTDVLYFRVYSPEEPLTFTDLPPNVANILKRTSYYGTFFNSRDIEFGDIG